VAQAVVVPPVTMVTVPVDNAGNAADTVTGFGNVGYDYRIGKYEVTAGQYTQFLNAVAATDTYGLYNGNMYSKADGCKIQQTLNPSTGKYQYSVDANLANRPVNYVSWGDAARFVNWLQNGQPWGAQNALTTEDGAYYLNGATSDAALAAVTRKTSWKWAIPNENEWCKAAYYDPTLNGATGGYWLYPTRSNNAPIAEAPTGTNATNGSANYGNAMVSTTNVGAYTYKPSSSYYDTFDQGGNVYEWYEVVFEQTIDGHVYKWRGARGGSYAGPVSVMQEGYRNPLEAMAETPMVGFRVVSTPEPDSITLFLCGAIAVWVWRRWKRQ
jgi:formylglycine-generating enzyme